MTAPSPIALMATGKRQKSISSPASGKAFTALREKMDPRFPLTVYYAFKQDDEDSGAAEDDGGVIRRFNDRLGDIA